MANDYEILIANPINGAPRRPNPRRRASQNPRDRYIIDSLFNDGTFDVMHDGDRIGIASSIEEAEQLINDHAARYGE